MSENFRNAAKAFIVKDGKLLLLKRRPNDVHKPGQWDIPGGRLELGENPFEGLKRETREETGLEIEMVMPIDVHFFTRDDGQKIQLTIFICKPKSEDIKLSEEHTEYKWMDLENPKDDFPEWLHGVIERFNKLELSKHI
ncbi:MAG: NUDIX domain-containing protein [Candidatus Doudnabacteria bacterium]|nr:NUDIX domain-containing protein [Candidatus Doudnabacteria bacterium]